MPTGVYLRTEEHRIKLKNSHIKTGDYNKCMKCNSIFYVCLSKLKNGKGKYCSLNCKRTSGLYKHSEETKKKIGIKHKGKKTPEHVKKLHSDRLKKSTGENAIRWKGGVSIGENRKKYMKDKQVEWCKNNKGKLTVYGRTRRSKISGNGGKHSEKEWEDMKKEYNYTCPYCNRREPDIRLHADHIVPISKGGDNNINNIQPLCQSCNSKKSNKII